LLTFVQRLGGTVFYAPLRVRVAPGRFREPDLVLLLDVNDPRNQKQARQPSLKGGRETLDGLSQLKTLRSGLKADSSILPYLV
jgi:hypothetical protein